MKAKRFYLNLEHRGLVRQGFGIQLSSKQTILSSAVALVRNIHLTMHLPQPEKGLMETVSHVRESQQDSASLTLLRIPRESGLIELAGMYVDRDQFNDVKEFKKSAHDGQYTLPADFGDHLTLRFFQGPANLISKTMSNLIATKKPGVVIPHSDGFYVDPSGREGTNEIKYVQIIFDDKLNPTIGTLALGAARSFEVVGNTLPASQLLKFIALAPPDKRHIRK